MLTRIALILCLLLIAIPAARAASFDCNKAKTVFEHAICDSPDLSKADETLSVAYATAIGGLSKKASDVMLKAQREWLGYTRDECADDVLPGNEDADVERASCLLSVYLDRIRGLENSRMIGGLRFYLVQRYRAQPDASGEGYTKVSSKDVTTPRIDGTDPLARAFNALMDKKAKDYDALFEPASEPSDDMINGDATTDNAASFVVTKVNDSRITLEVNDYWYGHGAAHGNYTITYIHFLKDQKRELEAGDIFTGTAWKKKLADLAFKQLKANLGPDGLFIESAKDIADTVANPGSWDFSDGGLIIRFQPYEVTAYAAGAVTVTIPWTDIQDDMSNDGIAIATY